MINAPNLEGRHVLVVGERLGSLANQAMPSARVEIGAAADLDLAQGMHLGLELIVIDVEAAEPAVLAGLIDTLGRRSSPPAVLLTGGHMPTVLIKALMRLPRSDVLEAPFATSDLARAAFALLAQAPAAAGAHRRSSCWSVIGAVGGCGATTVAVEVAANLANRFGKDRRVALVDLNLSGGAAGAYLGASANMQLAEASSAPDRIDAALLEAFAVKVFPGLDLLACPRDSRGYTRIAPLAVCRVLEVACQVYDFVVVDLPRHHQPWTMDVLAGSDEILVVSELTVPALLAARDLACDIETDMADGARPRIILNRVAARVFGPAPSLAEAEKALQRKADAGITSDWEAAATSANLGGSIARHRPRSKIVRDIDALVQRLAMSADVHAKKVA